MRGQKVAFRNNNINKQRNMAAIPENEAWRIFFDVYRGLPELWDEKSDLYKDKRKKKQAFNKLLDIYKMICKDANLDSLQKRILNIRRCYRREAKKVLASRNSGEEDKYVPTLWYFNLIGSLWDHETLVGSDQETQVAVECCLEEVGENGTTETHKAAPERRLTPPVLTYEESRKRLRSYLDQVVERNSQIVEDSVPLKKKRKTSDKNCTPQTQPYLILRKVFPKEDQKVTVTNQVSSVKDQEPQVNHSNGISTLQTQPFLRKLLPKIDQECTVQGQEQPIIKYQEYPVNPSNENSAVATHPYLILRNVSLNENQERPIKVEERPVKDEATTYAESWATSFRKLSNMQKIYAKKAIEDILVLGQLDCLSLNTVDIISASANAPNP